MQDHESKKLVATWVGEVCNDVFGNRPTLMADLPDDLAVVLEFGTASVTARVLDIEGDNRHQSTVRVIDPAHVLAWASAADRALADVFVDGRVPAAGLALLLGGLLSAGARSAHDDGRDCEAPPRKAAVTKPRNSLSIAHGWVCDACEHVTLERFRVRPDGCPCGATNWRGRIRIYRYVPAPSASPVRAHVQDAAGVALEPGDRVQHVKRRALGFGLVVDVDAHGGLARVRFVGEPQSLEVHGRQLLVANFFTY